MCCFGSRNLVPAIHVDANLTPNSHYFMEAKLPNGSGLLQTDNAPCHPARIIQEHNKLKALTWPPEASDVNQTERLWDMLDKRGRSVEAPPRNLQDLPSVVLQSPSLDGSDLFWWQKGEQHNIRQGVMMLRPISVQYILFFCLFVFSVSSRT